MRRVLLLSSLLAGFLMAGCHSSGNAGGSSDPAAEGFDPRPEMLKAMDSVNSYRRHLVEEGDESTRGGDTVPVRTELDVEAACPGRSHYRGTVNGRVRSERYFVEGTDKYLSRGGWKVNPRNWTVAPGCPGDQYNGFGPGGENDVVSGRNYLTLARLTSDPSRIKFTRGGLDTAEGMPCQIWDTTFTGNFDKAYTVQFCIGTSDKLPRRVLVTSPGNRIEIHYWDWNTQFITINLPT
jgi:hypothetical protein